MRTKWCAGLGVLLFATMFLCPAYGGFDIQSSGTSNATIFQRLITFMQDTVDLVDGPLAIALVVLSLIGALILWNFAPENNRWMGRAFRAVASAIFIFNIAGIVTYLRG